MRVQLKWSVTRQMWMSHGSHQEAASSRQGMRHWLGRLRRAVSPRPRRPLVARVWHSLQG